MTRVEEVIAMTDHLFAADFLRNDLLTGGAARWDSTGRAMRNEPEEDGVCGTEGCTTPSTISPCDNTNGVGAGWGYRWAARCTPAARRASFSKENNVN